MFQEDDISFVYKERHNVWKTFYQLQTVFFFFFFLNCYTMPVITDQPHISSEHELRPLGPKAEPQPTFLLI